jgi:hypothetical protein
MEIYETVKRERKEERQVLKKSQISLLRCGSARIGYCAIGVWDKEV